jgi:hypothetical protein
MLWKMTKCFRLLLVGLLDWELERLMDSLDDLSLKTAQK